MLTGAFVVAVIAGVVSAAIIGAVFGRLSPTRRRLRDDLDWYRTQYRIRSGYQCNVGNYCLRSFDGGRHWYEVDQYEDGGYRIIREADPQIIGKLDAMSAALDQIRRHGPIDPADANQTSLLVDIGLTVTERDPS